MANPRTFPQSLKPFDNATFRKPGAEYRGAPLWSWNNKLDKDQLLRQIDQLEAMGMGGFTMHVRVGLDTPYMGAEFMEAVRMCVARAKEKKMLAYLYDEDRWPSGYSGGAVLKENPEWKSKHLLFTRTPYSGKGMP
jgi:hypothetical protein